MSKRPTDYLEPSAKKRTQDRQGARDEEDDDSEVEDPGQFAKASEDVLKKRRIFKARRGGAGLATTEASQPTDANGAAPGGAPAPPPKSSNPFAGVSLFGAPAKPAEPAPAPPTTAPAAQPSAPAAPAQAELGSKDAMAAGDDTKDEAATSPQPAGNVATGAETAASKEEAAAPAATVDKPADKPSDQPAATVSSAPSAEGSSAPADKPTPENGGSSNFKGGFSFGSGLAKSVGGGFGSLAGSASSSGGFGAFGGQPAAAGASESGSGLFGGKPAFAFGSSAGADASTPAQSVFGGSSAGAAQDAPAAKPVLAPEAAVETGEEGERTVFSGEGTLFSFDGGWKERGRGELRVKVGQSGQARCVMRQRGNLRLLLNANLWEDMAVNTMDGGLGVTFAAHNAAANAAADGKEGGETAGTPPKEAQAGGELELTTFAFRVKVKQTLEEFQSAIESYKKADAAAANV